MNRQLKKISIITPFYNEESGADEFFERIIPHLQSLKTTYEIVCVNDGSRDRTIERLIFHHKKNPNIKVVDFSRNFGKEAAVSAGLDYATGDVVIPIDSDLQDPPELIPALIEKWKEGYDVVTAKRSGRQGESFLKKFTAKHFYRVIRYMSEVEIPVDVGDFRLMDRKVVEALSTMKEKNRFLKGMFAWVGFKQIDVEYERQARFKGSSKWNYWKLWNFALDGILMFSTMPLKIWSYLVFCLLQCIYLFNLSDHSSDPQRSRCPWLRLHACHHSILRRDPIDWYRCSRRIYRQNLYRSEGKTRLYCQRHNRL